MFFCCVLQKMKIQQFFEKFLWLWFLRLKLFLFTLFYDGKQNMFTGNPFGFSDFRFVFYIFVWSQM